MSITLSLLFLITGCTGLVVPYYGNNTIEHHISESKVVSSIGYGAIVNVKNRPLAQQKLMAIRAARVDAYRNIAEEIYGIRLTGQTTVKDMIVTNDSYRVTIDTMLLGAHINSITERKDGIFEASISMELTPRYVQCLQQPSLNCLNLSNQYQPSMIVVQ